MGSLFTRRRIAIASVIAVLALGGSGALWLRGGRPDASLTAPVTRGTLTATITTNGTLRPIQSLTYRSPIVGRETEITDLAPEGIHVNEGDLLIKLDTTEVEREMERARADLAQAELELQAAEGELEEAQAEVEAVSVGEGALTLEEARTRAQINQKKVDQLTREHEQMQPLLEKGFITRDELANTTNQLEQAEEELSLAKRRLEVLEKMTHPREKKRASIQLAQKQSQRVRAQSRVQDLQLRGQALRLLIENCTIFAKTPGLVVYEEYLNANPRRKIRVGDRVTSSQGVITIPEVASMVVETSVDEAQVHRVKPGLAAKVRPEAFPDLSLTGHVKRIGTLASASAFRPFDGKLFDLTIELDPTPADLRPEMTVRSDITVGTRENVLLVPVPAVFDRHGTLVAYVVTATGVEERRVEVGQSNDQSVEITAGLKEGERVMLVEPAAASPSPAQATPAVPGAATAPGMGTRTGAIGIAR